MAVELEKVRTQLEVDRKRQLSAAKTAHERLHQETVNSMNKERETALEEVKEEHRAALEEVEGEREVQEKILLARLEMEREEEKKNMAAEYQVKAGIGDDGWVVRKGYHQRFLAIVSLLSLLSPSCLPIWMRLSFKNMSCSEDWVRLTPN